jgi:hypothetical protein
VGGFAREDFRIIFAARREDETEVRAGETTAAADAIKDIEWAANASEPSYKAAGAEFTSQTSFRYRISKIGEVRSWE